MNPNPVGQAGPGAAPAAISDFNDLFGNIISFSLPLLAIALLFVVLFGGFKLITAGGDPGKTSSAKSMLTYGFIGLVLAASAFLIISIIANFSGLTGAGGTLNIRVFSIFR